MKPRRLLLLLPNWLGDVLLARPLLHACRGSWPEAEVAAVAPAPLLDLLSRDGCFEIGHARLRGPGAGKALARALRAWAPDATLVLPPSFSSAWLAWRSGARVRVGFAHEGRSPLLTRAIRRPDPGERHLSQEYRELGGAIGATSRPVPPLRLPEHASREATERLDRLSLGGTPLAVLGPGAAYGPAKRWAAERFAEVGRALVERGLTPLVCGAAAEAEVCGRVASAIGPRAVSLAGATQLVELAGICARASLAVCNDSGLAHLAASRGVPTVVVFGSTSSAWTAPLGPDVRIVQRPPVCSPCFRRTCRIGYVCLDAVTAGRVREACDAALEGRAA